MVLALPSVSKAIRQPKGCILRTPAGVPQVLTLAGLAGTCLDVGSCGQSWHHTKHPVTMCTCSPRQLLHAQAGSPWAHVPAAGVEAIPAAGIVA